MKNKTNNTHCVITKGKENNIVITLEGYVSKTRPVTLREVDNSEGKTTVIANASVNIVNQNYAIDYLLKTLAVDESAIYTSRSDEDTYHTLKVTGFNAIAQRMDKIMKAGNRVVIVGNASVNQWQSNDGVDHQEVGITIQDFWVTHFAN